MKKVVVFDAVGTLIQPNPAVIDAYQAAGQMFGSAQQFDDLKSRFRELRRSVFFSADKTATLTLDRPTTSEEIEREKWRVLVAEMFHDVSDQDSLFQLLWEHFSNPRHWEVFADVQACWPILHQLCDAIYVASNFDSRLCSVISELAPLHQVDGIFTSAAVGFSKPEQLFYAQVQTGIQRDFAGHEVDIVMVGDDWERDFHGPLNFGWRAVHLDRDQKTEGKADSIPTLIELIDLI